MTVPTTNPDDERQLLIRLTSGDDAEANRAIGEIVTRYEPIVEQTAWPILRDREAVEEIKQTVWITCWRQCQRLVRQGQLREYLVTIARTRALNLRRNEGRKATHARRAAELQLATGAHAVENDATLYLTVEDRERVANAAIEAMPRRRRDIYLRVARDGESYEQIAASLNLAPRTVINQMCLANQSIRRAIIQGHA